MYPTLEEAGFFFSRTGRHLNFRNEYCKHQRRIPVFFFFLEVIIKFGNIFLVYLGTKVSVFILVFVCYFIYFFEAYIILRIDYSASEEVLQTEIWAKIYFSYSRLFCLFRSSSPHPPLGSVCHLYRSLVLSLYI